MLRKLIVKVMSLCFLLLAITVQSQSNQREGIKATVWFGKEQYLICEPVILHGHLFNGSDSTIYFCEDDLLELTLTDTTGKVYPRLLYTKAYTFSPTDSIKPAETYIFEGNILPGYTNYDSLPAGDYSCFISHPYYFGVGETLDTAYFNIIEPQGLEKQAFKLFRRAQQLSLDKESSEEAFGAFEELIRLYPTSNYVPGALYQAALCYKYADSKSKELKSIDMYKKLIENHPDFISLDRYFGSICLIFENLKDKNGAVKMMNDLISKYPDSKVSEKADYWLEKIQKWEF